MDQQKGGPASNKLTTKVFLLQYYHTKNRISRKGGWLGGIYKDDLTVEKIKTDKRVTYELLQLKI